MAVIRYDHNNPVEIEQLFERFKREWEKLYPEGNFRRFVINWGSYKDLGILLNKLKGRRIELRGESFSRVRQRNILDACETILNVDISSLYCGRELDSERNYYVYAHLDTSRQIAIGKYGITSFAATLGMTHFPFYIGKGIGDRCFEISRNETHRKIAHKLQQRDLEIKVIKLKESLTELEAFQLEDKLIDIFGLMPYKGLLTNLDEGWKPEERRKLYLKAYETLRGGETFNDKYKYNF